MVLRTKKYRKKQTKKYRKSQTKKYRKKRVKTRKYKGAGQIFGKTFGDQSAPSPTPAPAPAPTPATASAQPNYMVPIYTNPDGSLRLTNPDTTATALQMALRHDYVQRLEDKSGPLNPRNAAMLRRIGTTLGTHESYSNKVSNELRKAAKQRREARQATFDELRAHLETEKQDHCNLNTNGYNMEEIKNFVNTYYNKLTDKWSKIQTPAGRQAFRTRQNADAGEIFDYFLLNDDRSAIPDQYLNFGNVNIPRTIAQCRAQFITFWTDGFSSNPPRSPDKVDKLVEQRVLDQYLKSEYENPNMEGIRNTLRIRYQGSIASWIRDWKNRKANSFAVNESPLRNLTYLDRFYLAAFKVLCRRIT